MFCSWLDNLWGLEEYYQHSRYWINHIPPPCAQFYHTWSTSVVLSHIWFSKFSPSVDIWIVKVLPNRPQRSIEWIAPFSCCSLFVYSRYFVHLLSSFWEKSSIKIFYRKAENSQPNREKSNRVVIHNEVRNPSSNSKVMIINQPGSLSQDMVVIIHIRKIFNIVSTSDIHNREKLYRATGCFFFLKKKCPINPFLSRQLHHLKKTRIAVSSPFQPRPCPTCIMLLNSTRHYPSFLPLPPPPGTTTEIAGRRWTHLACPTTPRTLPSSSTTHFSLSFLPYS